MTNNPPFRLSLFFPDGTLEGMKIVEKSNWNGCGLSIPRRIFGKHKNRPEFQRPGVYLLIRDMQFEPKIYIGEGDPLIYRLQAHEIKKEWDFVIAFTSKDHDLNKASIQFLESKLHQIASKNARFKIQNGNVPKEPSLSETDRAISEGYLRELLLCLPVLGLDLKEIPSLKPADAEKQFFLRGKNISAIGMETIDGFAVLKDSQATMSETRSIPTGLKTLRRCLIEKRILEEKVGQKSYVFTQDYLFASPSTASGVVLGRSSNGRTEWKNSKEQSIKDLEQRA